MKEKFTWYFPLSEEEITTIWSNGILTVDANVLLDLYRYHENTRNALISVLKGFNGRLWLSNQAAEEFIRNRTKVIISSEKTFKQAQEEVDKLKLNYESTLAQLKGNRIIPTEVATGLLDKIKPAIDEAQEAIAYAKSQYPKYLQDDPILNELAEMFSNAIGEGFNKEDLDGIKIEAEYRKINEIPPGYLDHEKDGDRPYGDFFLWKQILSHSKNKDIPIIFVTSERKEDWWEKQSGKTIGPRSELLREAYEFSGRRVLIYQTDRFLEIASERSGDQLDDRTVEEIRAVDSLRSDVESAVEVVEQNIQSSTELLHEGVLVINLHRPVRNLTASGNLEPNMHNIPNINAELIDGPQGLPGIKIRAGAGTKRKFNLHVISNEFGSLLPIGQYKLKYKATCEISDIDEQAMVHEIEPGKSFSHLF
jgi:hypothetical protein